MQSAAVKFIHDNYHQLPLPQKTYKLGDGTVFDIFRAKNLFSPDWNHPHLEALVLFARSSFGRYGARPLLDNFDAKAAIYIIRASYPDSASHGRTEEWLSIRMVPGDGVPIGGGELELYSYKDRDLESELRDRFFPKDSEFWRFVASSSRMCGIHPYSAQSTSSSKTGTDSQTKHRFTALCFAMIHLEFLADYPLLQFPYRFITAIIRSDFAGKILAVRTDKISLGPCFTPAHELLKIPEKNIHLKRDLYAYAFPLYWLDPQELELVFKELVTAGKFKSLPPKETWGKILMTQGEISGAKITGEALRQMVDSRVQEIPKLKITESAKWYAALRDMLALSGAVGL